MNSTRRPNKFVRLDENAWRCDARIRIEDINQTIGSQLPSDEYDSLAGYVFDLFERIPSVGEQVTAGNLRFTVESMEGHRILSVRVDRIAVSENNDENRAIDCFIRQNAVSKY